MRTVLIALLVLAVCPAFAQDKEKLSANDISVRTVLAFKVADAAVQKLLPAGFAVNSPTAGPAKGTNLNVVLIDYLMVQDPEGKTLPPRTTLALTVPGKNASGQAVGVVVGGFIPQPAVPGPYFVFGSAKSTVDRRSHTDAEGKSIISETWETRGDDGSTLEVELQFARGVPERGKVQSKIHSAAK